MKQHEQAKLYLKKAIEDEDLLDEVMLYFVTIFWILKSLLIVIKQD